MAGFVMGAFSFAYHATNNLFTQYLDFLGMYLWIVYLIVLRLRAAYGLARGASAYWGLVAGLTLGTHLVHQANLPFQFIVAGLAVALLYVEHACRKRGLAGDGRYIAGAAAAFFVGELCSLIDLKRVFCRPEDPFLQGHAFWHCFGGVGMTLLSLYHRRKAE